MRGHLENFTFFPFLMEGAVGKGVEGGNDTQKMTFSDFQLKNAKFQQQKSRKFCLKNRSKPKVIKKNDF
jgi:hypothetical protein